MSLRLEHRVFLADARAHLVEVETTVKDDDQPLPSPLVLLMPVWTPGSYLVREHARHVEALTCTRDGAPIDAPKVRKNAWSCDPAGARAVTLRYRLYCNELTVRTNHFDETHAFLCGAATFLAIEGREDAPHTVELHAPEGHRILTSLDETPRARPTFAARDLEELVDCPFEIGTPREVAFEAAGVPVRLAVTPAYAATPQETARLAGHVKAILETSTRLFGGVPPWPRYLVQLHLTSRGRGGLEHASGSTLLASRESLTTRDAYLDLLSLLAHEALHAWNVKRIRPAGLVPTQWDRESYTRLLWWFEGATSYYDWRVLRLADLCTVPEYLGHLESEMSALDATHGRLVQALEEASFDSWIKLYRPDENTPNSSVSYYRKGELVCALMDLEIRARTNGCASLDDVLELLWREHGLTGTPVAEDAFPGVIERATGVGLGGLFDTWVRSPGELDYARAFGHVGLAVERHARPDAPKASLGLRLRSEGGRTQVVAVVRGGAAQRAGIDVGDELLSFAGRRVEGSSADALLARCAAGETVEAMVARDGRVLARTVALDGPRADRVKLAPKADATPVERARFRAWLHHSHPVWEPR